MNNCDWLLSDEKEPWEPCSKNISVPCLDVGHSQVVTALASRPALAEEQEQRHLLHQAGGEVELGLEEHPHVPGCLVGEEGGVARHPAGEGRLVESHGLLAPPSSPPVATQTDEALLAE